MERVARLERSEGRLVARQIGVDVTRERGIGGKEDEGEGGEGRRGAW